MKQRNSYGVMPVAVILFCVLCAAILPLAGSGAARAAQEAAPASQGSGVQTESTQAQEQAQNQYVDLSQSIEKTLDAEAAGTELLKEQLTRLQKLQKDMDTELNSYKVQTSAYGNLLLLPTAPVEDLEKAIATQKEAMGSLSEKLQELSQNLESIKQLRQQTDEQITLNQAQLTELKAPGAATDPVAAGIVKQLQSLTKLLATKREILEKLQGIYGKQAEELNEVQATFTTLSQKFDTQVNERKMQGLFERKTSPLAELSWKQAQEVISSLFDKIRTLLSARLWSEQLRMLWKSGGILLVTSALLFIIAQVLLFKFRRLCLQLEGAPSVLQYPWRCFSLQIFDHSLPLLGAVVFIYAYGNLRSIYTSIPFVRVVVYILLTWLLTSWVKDFLKLWNEGNERPRIPDRLVELLRGSLLHIIRFFAITFAVLSWLSGSESVVILFVRLAFEIALLSWTVVFLRAFRRETAGFFEGKSRWMTALQPTVITLGYVIIGGGFLLELAGYGQLALYWYASWGQMAIVLLWGFLFFLLIREWDLKAVKIPAIKAGESGEKIHPVRWLLVRVSWLAWLAALSVLLLVAWGARQSVILGFFRILNHPMPIGGIDLRLLGIAYAFMILLFTHAATRLWRTLLKKKILAHSGLEIGVRESITTITVYLFWGIGILMALHALGIGTTSLAVVFGALGIGLGFGLQNIFNNFVSGLIILFERPIQVGDVVEINGIWGAISKINFRSTVVQTYDNASLIIPNSEFISSQLINWSFKDLRVRRSITIGVAYGSDTALVQSTLLDIADKHPKVHRIPKPDILFVDFGDSALIFKLRFWTTIDQCLSVETDIRFEIDRLFRERNIEIPFPQRDIHIPQKAGEAILEAGSDKQVPNGSYPGIADMGFGIKRTEAHEQTATFPCISHPPGEK